VAAVVLTGVLARACIDLATPLLPKVNGAYYLVQVRSLLERGRLAFADFPLVFWIEAALARLLSLLGAGGPGGESAIVAAVKAVDILLPPLAALPVISLARRLAQAGQKRGWPALAAGLFAVLSWSPVVMTGDMQKNAVGMAAMAGFAMLGHSALARGGAGRWVLAALVLSAAGLTHAGAFAAALALAAIAGCVFAVTHQRGGWRKPLLVLVPLVAALAVLAAVLLATDRERFMRMAGVLADPLSLFRGPMFLALFDGRVGPLDAVNVLAVTTVCGLGLAALVRRRREVPAADRALVGSCAVLGLVLASPLLGVDWAERLPLLASVPAAIVLGFLLASSRRPAPTRILASLASVLCVAGFALSVGPLGRPSIPPESVVELRGISARIEQPERTLVIARHGLEWWAAWYLRTRVSQEFDVDPSVWAEYEAVFMLAGRAPAAPGGGGGRKFEEVRLGPDARTIHEGPYYTLSLAPTAPPFYPLSRPQGRP
jgi:hypothetical protein